MSSWRLAGIRPPPLTYIYNLIIRMKNSPQICFITTSLLTNCAVHKRTPNRFARACFEFVYEHQKEVLVVGNKPPNIFVVIVFYILYCNNKCFAWLVIIFITFVVEQIWIYLLECRYHKGSEDLIKNINVTHVKCNFDSQRGRGGS